MLMSSCAFLQLPSRVTRSASRPRLTSRRAFGVPRSITGSRLPAQPERRVAQTGWLLLGIRSVSEIARRKIRDYNLFITVVEPPLHIPEPPKAGLAGSAPRRVLMMAYRFPPAGDAIASRRPEGLYR